MHRVRVALVGAGMMGANHARVVAAQPGAELACIVDVDGERARRLADEYDAPWSTDLAAALDADAVIVATPAEAHVGVASAVIAGGLPLLVEKRYATSSLSGIRPRAPGSPPASSTTCSSTTSTSCCTLPELARSAR